MNIAIIPARGGSKRIPRKNIKEFHGKPMIAYSIEAALESKCFDKVIVSTDDIEIADVAIKYGAEVPFLRPDEIADDYATTLDVMKHSVQWLLDSGYILDYVCCIYATAPFLTGSSIISGLTKLKLNNLDYCFTATSYAFPIQRAFTAEGDGIEMFNPEHINTRSQDLKEAYHDAGQFYWGKVSSFLHKKPVFLGNASFVELPRLTVQDIDTLEDWSNATLIYSILKGE